MATCPSLRLEGSCVPQVLFNLPVKSVTRVDGQYSIVPYVLSVILTVYIYLTKII